MLTIDDIRKDFPILSRVVNGKSYAYLDNTATTQKPLSVIQAMTTFLTHENATIHRGIYHLSQQATERCDASRRKLQTLINAYREEEIIFTKGTTESINLVAATYGATFKKGDEIIISVMEHHANIVPWQQLCEKQGCVLKVVPFDESGNFDFILYEKQLSSKTKLVAVTHCSNVLGSINPVRSIVEKAHQYGAKVLIDGAQSIAHMPIDVQILDCDFYCFSAHKMYGPTGIGVLYGKYELLEKMPPYQTGGDMIDTVTFEKTTFALPPARFEAGTPAISEMIGFGATVDYINDIGYEIIQEREQALFKYVMAQLAQIEGITIYGTSPNKAAIISFNIEGVHAHDAGTVFDELGVAVRVGHHCAQPIMTYFGIPATIRVSMSFYNTESEMDQFIVGVKQVKEFFG
jgi:cysteine desulfurase/selenocysteine lyase